MPGRSRGADEIVVRRVEWRAWANAGAILVIGALVVAFALTRVHSPVQQALVGALAVLLVVAAWIVYRPRATVVIGRRDIGWRQGAQRWDVPRTGVAGVRVVPGMWTQMVLVGPSGTAIRSVALAYFSPSELRGALRRAGIRVG